jgi:putative serine protease PepD
MGAIIACIVALVLVLGVGSFAGWAFARSSNAAATNAPSMATIIPSSYANNPEGAQEAAIAKVEPSVVQLNVMTSQGEDLGSGVIIDQQGDIVTNNHVVTGGQSISVMFSNGTTEQAQIIGTDASEDLAVVRVKPIANMAVATIGNSSQLTVGQEVMAIGNPLGITETATHGIISALNRSVSESSTVTLNNVIQTDTPINPGNSGGALITLQGQLIGIPTLVASDSETNTPANGIGFAISSNTVKTIVASILAHPNGSSSSNNSNNSNNTNLGGGINS